MPSRGDMHMDGNAIRDELSSGPIGGALARWQESGDPELLAAVVAAARPLAEAVAAKMLRSRGVTDPSAVDDVMSLVLDHLRRLPGAVAGERPVAPFRGEQPGTDAGVGYVCQLAEKRALDVARQRRRRSRHTLPFSLVDAEVQRGLVRREAAAQADLLDRLADALDGLEPRLRTVVEMLLDGKSQAVIAHVLGVCEGTVSRARSRAVDHLRRLIEP